jgi:cobalt-zinc-cadmium efflux system outer membrane protein
VDQAMRMALANNLAFRAELERIGVAEGALRQAKVLPNPVAAGGLTTDRFYANEGERDWSAGIEQEFETAGKRRYRILTARSDLERIRHETESAERDLIARTQEAYFTLLRAARDLKLAHETVSVIQRLADLTAERVKLGEAPGVELNLEKIELAREQRNQLEFERRHREAAAELNLLIGRPASSALTPASDFSAPTASLPAARELTEYALHYHPDALAAQSSLEARKSAARLARAFRFPNVTLGAAYQQQQSIVGLAAPSATGTLSEVLLRHRLLAFQATVPLPLFNRNQGNIVSADYEARAAEEKALYTGNVIERQIATALSNYQSRVQTRSLYEVSILPQLQRNFDAIYEAYRLGNENIFAVIQVQRTVFDTRHEYLQTLLDLERDRVGLEKAAGLPLTETIQIPELSAGEDRRATQ